MGRPGGPCGAATGGGASRPVSWLLGVGATGGGGAADGVLVAGVAGWPRPSVPPIRFKSDIAAPFRMQRPAYPGDYRRAGKNRDSKLGACSCFFGLALPVPSPSAATGCRVAISLARAITSFENWLSRPLMTSGTP